MIKRKDLLYDRRHSNCVGESSEYVVVLLNTALAWWMEVSKRVTPYFLQGRAFEEEGMEMTARVIVARFSEEWAIWKHLEDLFGSTRRNTSTGRLY